MEINVRNGLNNCVFEFEKLETKPKFFYYEKCLS